MVKVLFVFACLLTLHFTCATFENLPKNELKAYKENCIICVNDIRCKKYGKCESCERLCSKPNIVIEKVPQKKCEDASESKMANTFIDVLLRFLKLEKKMRKKRESFWLKNDEINDEDRKALIRDFLKLSEDNDSKMTTGVKIKKDINAKATAFGNSNVKKTFGQNEENGSASGENSSEVSSEDVDVKPVVFSNFSIVSKNVSEIKDSEPVLGAVQLIKPERKNLEGRKKYFSNVEPSKELISSQNLATFLKSIENKVENVADLVKQTCGRSDQDSILASNNSANQVDEEESLQKLTDEDRTDGNTGERILKDINHELIDQQNAPKFGSRNGEEPHPHFSFRNPWKDKLKEDAEALPQEIVPRSNFEEVDENKKNVDQAKNVRRPGFLMRNVHPVKNNLVNREDAPFGNDATLGNQLLPKRIFPNVLPRNNFGGANNKPLFNRNPLFPNLRNNPNAPEINPNDVSETNRRPFHLRNNLNRKLHPRPLFSKFNNQHSLPVEPSLAPDDQSLPPLNARNFQETDQQTNLDTQDRRVPLAPRKLIDLPLFKKWKEDLEEELPGESPQNIPKSLNGRFANPNDLLGSKLNSDPRNALGRIIFPAGTNGSLNLPTDKMYFDGKGLNLPISLSRQDDGTVQLYVDVDRLCGTCSAKDQQTLVGSSLPQRRQLKMQTLKESKPTLFPRLSQLAKRSPSILLNSPIFKLGGNIFSGDDLKSSFGSFQKERSSHKKDHVKRKVEIAHNVLNWMKDLAENDEDLLRQ